MSGHGGTGRPDRGRDDEGRESRREGEVAHAHAQYERDRAENLLQRARRSTDPAEAARLRDQGERLKERSERALREEHEPWPDDQQERHPD
ncbi:DUF6381 family protein [Streptomyces sp. P9(2023)]|uniref:DUF6381 family protein n=1 Tax=Streptomyces sp. P9(2023) TaxID=3064394 RepID=UPI0028F42717|nr:DUF6381 family protein [Streptomyces sp. P9(2023)]MDT9687170.1 DUF6381 family protein [Streptomyces sp. P9(2023)]